MKLLSMLGAPSNPWLLPGVTLVWLASLVAVGAWQRADGAAAERVANQSVKNTELAEANRQITLLTAQARKDEAEHAKRLVEQASHYEGELQHEKELHESAVAAVRRGDYRLRDKGAKCPAASPGGEAGSTSSRGNGQAEAELSDEAAEFLLSEASRANAIVAQLALCQAVVEEDRRLCGAQPQGDEQ